MTYAYSQGPLREMVKERFVGHWKYVEKSLFEISETRAARACFELALYLRTFDDDEQMTKYYAALKNPIDCGEVHFGSGAKTKRLGFRDAANKIIHSARLEWTFDNHKAPLLICHGRPNQKDWVRAEIHLISLVAVCGRIAS